MKIPQAILNNHMVQRESRLSLPERERENVPATFCILFIRKSERVLVSNGIELE